MGNMRFKVGDRVRIKSLDWYNKNKTSEGCLVCGSSHINPEMICMLGKIATIFSVEGNHYRIKEYGWNWTDEMIECKVEEETKPKFNVGDRVITDTNMKGKIIEIVEEGWYSVEFEPYNGIPQPNSVVPEEHMSLAKDEMSLDKAGQITYFEYEGLSYTLPEGYIFKDENGNVINATKIVLEKKKKEYPKTYEECAEIIAELTGSDCNPKGCMGYMSVQLTALQKLLICRDAYWKIAGEEMGLGKPWTPQDTNTFSIFYDRLTCEIEKQDGYCGANSTLEFPTEEMRDAFYENFKELIESCKELL